MRARLSVAPDTRQDDSAHESCTDLLIIVVGAIRIRSLPE